MRYEWDDEKNLENIRKHKIDFADVPSIFSNPMLLELDDRQDYEEDRWTGIGLLQNLIAVVVFVERRHDTVRIISARKANKHERKRYTDNFKN